MTIFIGQGTATGPVKVAGAAGIVTENIYKVEKTTAGYAAGDIVDVGILPADYSINDWNILLSGTVTVEIGILDGNPRSDDPARTIVVPLYSGTLNAGVNRAAGASVAEALSTAFKAVGYDRSIGVKFTNAANVDIFELSILMVVR